MTKETQEQLDIIHAIQHTSSNIIVDAVAGSGKTYTIIKALQQVPKNTSILTLAFNKSIQVELKDRLPSSITCRTLSGHGYQAWRQKVKKSLKVDTDKLRQITNTLADTPIVNEAIEHLSTDADTRALIKSEIWKSIRDLIDLCRENLIVSPETIKTLHNREALTLETFTRDLKLIALENGIDILFPGIFNLVASGLHTCALQAFQGIIDFTDMIWAPLCFKASFDKFDWVVVDESQDLNESQHLMIRETLDKNSRLIIVGDPYQAIYGWRGALSNSMQQLKEEYSMVTLPLSFCFRCPRSVVEKAQKLVPHIKYWEHALPGRVSGKSPWTPSDIPLNSAVLSRTNAPLMRVGFAFLAQGLPIKFQNNRLGRSLKSLFNKIGIETRATVLKKKLFKPLLFAEADQKVNAWLQTMQTKCMQNNSEHLIGLYQDQHACMKAVLLATPDMISVGKTLDSLFDSPKGVILSTIHGAKGLEWENVFFLDAAFLPRPALIKKTQNAKRDFPDDIKTKNLIEQLQQEYNLCYVAITRALQTLTYISIDSLNKEENENEI